MSGYFVPPATGDFRFVMTCDRECRLDFDDTPFDFDNPADPTWEAIKSASENEWRYHYDEDLYTDWFTLSEGEYYPIRALHRAHAD